MDIPTRYNPNQSEEKWYKFWEDKGYFKAQVNPDKKSFCIVIPPPNVTGILHMGHALNNTIQDILIRYYRMNGCEALWMPGTDHAGIATQNVVEKAIAKEGLKRQDLGRDKFLERVWLWKEQYGSTIINQLKRLGCSCDWSRTRFTMDEEYSKAIVEVFIRLNNKKLIFPENYIVNWCPRCQTALSDEEAPHQELQGFLYYIKYPFKESTVRSPQSTVKTTSVDSGQSTMDYITVATTRPETMLGDTAVAVNPKDKRYKKLVGKTLILPLIGRKIKIISDSMVDKDFGTGAVKVTPAHDLNDYALGRKHCLDFVNIMYPDGSLNEYAGAYKGMDRFQAREAVLRDLKDKGLIEKVEPHQLSAGHCYRCHTIIEPYLSEQWFVSMGQLAKPAIEAVKKGKIKFHPKRWTKVYLNWMENIQHWCISRQIWWGHRIPVYYCRVCKRKLEAQKRKDFKFNNGKSLRELYSIVSEVKPEKCTKCNSTDIYQDEDVLDTWFSSWLWPFATFYWKAQDAQLKSKAETELKYFYPTSVLVTAPEIIFFWVARMIMAGLEFMGDIPFSDVYIHGTVRDIRGKKMSKSLGNAIDPLEIISEFGTDALRFSLASCASQGDLFLSKEKFQMGRNFANKLWNAARLILLNLDTDNIKGDLCVVFKQGNLNLVDRWILSRFYTMLKGLNKHLKNYRFNEAANILYAFIWHELCDWYLEISKSSLKDRKSQFVMYKILEKTLRALHPFMPFITEEIWQMLPHQGESIMIQPWPHVQEGLIDKKLELHMESIFNIVKSIRNLRTQIGLKPDREIKVSLHSNIKLRQELLKQHLELIGYLARLGSMEILTSSKRPANTISAIAEGVDIYLHFSGLLDVAKEQQKIKADIARQTGLLKAKKSRMSNKDFVSKAPKQVVENEKASIAEIESAIARLERMHNELR